MHKVVSINLNGNAYQLEEPGYEALRAYLQRAEARLQGNPDRAEIMADLEQAIAEKCARYLAPHKTVVTAVEVETIIAEMGPVESGEAPGQTDASSSARNENASASTGATDGGTRRLYQIREGAMLAGVCNGIAAFFNIDVTVVRIVFVILTFATFGAWILAYFVMAIIIPYADTSEDRAAAYGLRLSAQELIDQARLHHSRFRARHEWRRTWRREQRAWHRHWSRHWNRHFRNLSEQARAASAASAPAMGYAAHAILGVTLPLFAIVNAAVFVAWIFALLSVITTGTIFGWHLPMDLPLWGSILILIALYAIATAPLRAARHAGYHAWGGHRYGPWGALAGMFWLAFTVLFFWLAYHHIPQVHALIDQLPSTWQRTTNSLIV
jgi:phage shock protein PspC (stress-responsive transcriptional regulator)